jgi:hypothetical protein
MDSQTEDADEGKIVYDWSPPSGQKQNFFYKGAAINRDQVNLYLIATNCLNQIIKNMFISMIGEQNV